MMTETDCPPPSLSEHARPPDHQTTLNTTDEIGTGDDLNDSGDDIAGIEHNTSTDAVHSDQGCMILAVKFCLDIDCFRCS